MATSSNDITWSTGSGGVVFLPAFRVTAGAGSGVPDSGGTILLMLSSVAVLFAFKRLAALLTCHARAQRRRKAVEFELSDLLAKMNRDGVVMETAKLP